MCYAVIETVAGSSTLYCSSCNVTVPQEYHSSGLVTLLINIVITANTADYKDKRTDKLIIKIYKL